MRLRNPFRKTPERHFPEATDFPHVELRGGDTRLVIVPSLGGKIAIWESAGRDWLWKSDIIPLAPGEAGRSYVETADTGGFDECFPTVGACRVPGWVKQFGGYELPDHGELWSQEPAVDVRTGPAGQSVTCQWEGKVLPYRFARTVRVDGDGGVVLHYAAINDGKERLPFLWSSHPLFPLTSETTIHIPEGSRMQWFSSHGIDLGELRSEHRWPLLRGGGKAYDFSQPWSVAKRYACKLFVEPTDGRVAVREGEHELLFTFDPRAVTHVGVWINKREWTPFRDAPAACHIGVEPAIGSPDTLEDALGDWKSVAWLDPGETQHWSLEVRGRRIDSDELKNDARVAAVSND